jgi:transketolase
MYKEKKIELEEKARKLRRQIVGMISKARAAHIASAFSVLDILIYLYAYVLRIDPKHPQDPERDRFILSKGWGASALYTVLADKGFFDPKELESYCMNGSRFVGITTMSGVPGIEATTGSMGHGLPIGNGMAVAAKKQGRASKVVVVISDGELNEGSTWEAMLFASHHHLDNLTVVVDYNAWQSFGRTRDILNLDPLPEKFRAFGWEAVETNGHDFLSLHEAFSSLSQKSGKPTAIIAHTIKGKGVSFMEDKNEWHYKYPTESEVQSALKELL